MTETATTIPHFNGQTLRAGDEGYDRLRSMWNAMVDRHPALIARPATNADVAAAIRFGREQGLEIGVRCGGHSVVGHAVPEGGLMVDLSAMAGVRVDPARRLAWVQGGALLRSLDHATEAHGLATTAGNVSHTGVGGLTLGGGMGWLARQVGLACDNVAAYTVVTADGETVHASADEHPDLYWGLRGGGGNFGIVTEFEFRLHPITHRTLEVDLIFEPDDAPAALRVWRELLADAPREATLTASAMTAGDAPFIPEALRGRPAAAVGFVWVGDPEVGRRYAATFRAVGEPVAEHVEEQSYVALQASGDERNRHGLRRYSNGHYLTALPDAAIDAFLARGLDGSAEPADWTRIPNGGMQAYGGAIADIDHDDTAFSHRDALVEWGSGGTWTEPAEDAERIAAARAYGAAVEPFASGVYVNALGEDGQRGVRRAYSDAKLARLGEIKRRYDPSNVFHLNHNIPPE